MSECPNCHRLGCPANGDRHSDYHDDLECRLAEGDHLRKRVVELEVQMSDLAKPRWIMQSRGPYLLIVEGSVVAGVHRPYGRVCRWWVGTARNKVINCTLETVKKACMAAYLAAKCQTLLDAEAAKT
jgi:hypothetical protein